MSVSDFTGWRSFAAAASLALATILLPHHEALGSGEEPAGRTTAGSGTATGFEPGTVIRDCPRCPELVVVPPGTFRMGDLRGGGDVDEAPVRTVTIAQPFAVARYETTFEQWDACVAAGECRSGVRDIGFGRGDRPVILVSWKDAKTYASWLSTISGMQFRLPTEAEWEYMARAGSEARYPWGDAIGRGNANCDGCGSPWDDERTAPAGSFPANAFGVHDAVGNVYEWVEDCGRSDYAGAPADGSAWEPDGACVWRMMRGGSWLSLPRANRTANRVRNPDGFQDIHVGFRVVRSLF